MTDIIIKHPDLGDIDIDTIQDDINNECIIFPSTTVQALIDKIREQAIQIEELEKADKQPSLPGWGFTEENQNF